MRLILLLAVVTFSCGGGRHLQSITISQTANGQQIQLVATGTFSAAPITVTPLAVDWGVGPFAPPPPGNLDYQLTTEPFSFHCQGSGPYLPIMAWAPPNPHAPANGAAPFKSMVIASATPNCHSG